MSASNPLASFIREKHALGATREEIVATVVEHGGDAALVDEVLNGKDPELAHVKKEEELIRRYLLEKQSLGKAVLAGTIVACLCAVLWASIAVITDYQIGWIAIIVGGLVAWAIRRFGRGMEVRFRVVGVLASIAGILFGNALTAIFIIHQTEKVPLLDVLILLGHSEFYVAIIEYATPMDGLFYLLAAVYGWFGSCIPMNDQAMIEYAKQAQAEAGS